MSNQNPFNYDPSHSINEAAHAYHYAKEHYRPVISNPKAERQFAGMKLGFYTGFGLLFVLLYPFSPVIGGAEIFMVFFTPIAGAVFGHHMGGATYKDKDK